MRPNVDTLYSISILDFSESDVEASLPLYYEDPVVMINFWDTTAAKTLEHVFYDPDATILVRIWVYNNGTDETLAREYINSLSVYTTNKQEPLFSPLQPSDFALLLLEERLSIFQLLSGLANRDPPQIIEYAKQVPGILKMAGISDGTYIQPLGVDLNAAYDLMNTRISDYKDSLESTTVQNNGWYTINPATQGTFINSTDLLGRN
ncbi:hypothetical protein PISL3812_04050 [Talaromyces islandicus]|uniref:Uncharacterized protein n=1 Tax=Talaromyces islandicus TaxID=28573 RepID=A0A0U1LW67_TALIS|nr:hypothetical protein PISL3812_04050 [Talaromyces islandicus]